MIDWDCRRARRCDVDKRHSNDPALVLGELKTVRARIDRQIAVIRTLIRSTGKQHTVLTTRPHALIGYARDRPSGVEAGAYTEADVD